jgi:hypothetical protein
LLLSQADFAKLAQVNRVQITKGLKAKKLTRGRDGMMATTERKNAAYLEKHGVDASSLKDRPEVMLKRAEADVRVKNSQADWRDIQIAERRKQLIPRLLVAKWFTQLNAGLKPTFLEMPKRLLPKVAALVRAGKDAEAQTLWETETCDALARVLNAADDATREALKNADG